MKSKLIVVESPGGYYELAWENDGDTGAHIGQRAAYEVALREHMRSALMQCNFSEFEFYYVELAALGHAVNNPHYVVLHESQGYRYQTLSSAREALRVLKAARKQAKIKYNTGRKLPHWAEKALAEGWTPPARWKPA